MNMMDNGNAMAASMESKEETARVKRSNPHLNDDNGASLDIGFDAERLGKRVKIEDDLDSKNGFKVEETPAHPSADPSSMPDESPVAGPSSPTDRRKHNAQGNRDGRDHEGRGRNKTNTPSKQSKFDSRAKVNRIRQKQGDTQVKPVKVKKENDDDGDNDNDEGGSSKLPKKKVAMLIGYLGIGYSGSQINPGVKTIESEVFEACVKAGCISEDNSDNTAKVGLMRAARTDAGVSAAVNVLNLKLILSPPSKPQDVTLEAHINAFLPLFIRVWRVIRVQGAFHSRTMCESRIYNYSLPTYAFLEPKDGTLMAERITWRDELERSDSWWSQHTAVPLTSDTVAPVPQDGPPIPLAESHKLAATIAATQSDEVIAPVMEAESAAKPTVSAFAADQKLRRTFRISPEQLSRVKSALEAYLGSHNFWNFTVGKEFSDRSCQRVIKGVEVSEPFMVNDTEWLSLKFHGQSFMLHQIRKMVGLVIMAVRTHTPPSLIPETFGPIRLNLPKAPALGLLLEQPFFGSYNRKIADSNAHAAAVARRKEAEKKAQAALEAKPLSDPSIDPKDEEADLPEVREALDIRPVVSLVEAFKHEIVFKAMFAEEERDDTFAKWINLHDSQIGPDFDYLNAKGVIPQSLKVKKKVTAAPKTAADASALATNALSSNESSLAPNVNAGEDEEDLKLLSEYTGKRSADLDG